MKTKECETPPGGVVKKRRIRIKRPADGVRLLNKVIRDLLNEEMDIGVARTLIYGLSTLPRLYECSEFSDRLTRLEERLGERR